MKLVFCTHNENKVKEIARLTSPDFEWLALNDIGYLQEIPEPFQTLEENARTKAETVFRASGLPCFSEDSGLFTDTLNGEPGVHSARYAGANANASNNMALLLERMKGKTNRKATFKTVIAFFTAEQCLYFTGECSGTLLENPTGTEGFGYDPLFVPDGDTRTFAQMSLDEKNNFSHRRKAMDGFLNYINKNFK
jgi:XTP/dITP diphosphohydrolase